MRRAALAAIALVWLAAPSPGEEAEGDARKRLEALERRLAEQEKEIEALKADREGAPDRRRDGASVEAQARGGGAPLAPEQAPAQKPPATGGLHGGFPRGEEEFEKKFGKEAVITWDQGFGFRYVDPDEPDPGRRVLFSLRPGGMIQVDGRSFTDADHPGDDTFLMRRARLLLTGTFYRSFDFVVEGEFAETNAQIRDAFLNASFTKYAQVRGGNFKVPILREQITSDKYLDFLERPLATGVMALDRELGFMLHGDADFANYQAMIANGTGPNARDNNDDKEFLGRLALTPFKPARGLLRDVEIAGSYSYGHTRDFVPVFRTYAGTTFLTIPTTAVNGATQKGYRQRTGAELTIPVGPFKAQAEWIQMRVEDVNRTGAGAGDVTVTDWYVDLMYMVTGEARGVNRRAVPETSFDPLDGGWGAFEVGLRFEHLDTNEALSASGDGTDEVNIGAVALNWYWNPLMKLAVNVYRAWFDETVTAGDERIENEDVIIVRWQLEF